MKKKPIKAYDYLKREDIIEHLVNVEYIILAQQNPDSSSEFPIHFTIFLNTPDELPNEVKDAVLDGFCEQYKIDSTDSVLNELAKVGFAKTDEDTLMPMHLFKESDQKDIEHIEMHIIDFIGTSKEFTEVQEDGHTGWSYSYS